MFIDKTGNAPRKLQKIHKTVIVCVKMSGRKC